MAPPAPRVRTRARGGRGFIQVEGAARMRRDLKAAAGNVQDLKDAHLAVAKMVDDAADADPRRPRRTGALDKTSRPLGQAKEAIVRVGNARVQYAGPIHYGWKNRGITGQPWVYRAFREHTENSFEIYVKKLQDICDNIEGTTPGL